MFFDSKPLVRKNPNTVVLVLYNELVDDVFSVMNANELVLSFSRVQNGVISLLKEPSHFCFFMMYFLPFYYNAGTLDYLIIARCGSIAKGRHFFEYK